MVKIMTYREKSGGSLSFRNNSLNTVRLMAALQVFYGHAVVHMKLPSNTIVSSIFGIFQGVPIFFMMSGFLIWNSLDKTPDLKSYVKKRILRLYPELWCAVFLSILSIVILYDDFHIGQLVLFTIGQATIFQFWTPDSLRSFGCGTPNGSLWTISVIVQFYVVAWFLKKLIHKKKNLITWISILVTGIVIEIISTKFSDVLPTIVYKLYNQTIIPYIWIFILGAFICEFFQDIVPIMKKSWYIGLALLLVQGIIGMDFPGAYGLIKTLLQSFTWFGFAYALPKWNVKRDISYEIYLFHMVVINVFIQLGYDKSWFYFAIVIVIVISLAIAANVSWASKRNIITAKQ